MVGNAEMILAAASAQPSAETFTTVMDHIAQGFEALGTGVLVAGTVWSFVLAVVTWRRSGQPSKGYLALRTAIGGTLLLGLEILVCSGWKSSWRPTSSVRSLSHPPSTMSWFSG